MKKLARNKAATIMTRTSYGSLKRILSISILARQIPRGGATLLQLTPDVWAQIGSKWVHFEVRVAQGAYADMGAFSGVTCLYGYILIALQQFRGV